MDRSSNSLIKRVFSACHGLLGLFLTILMLGAILIFIPAFEHALFGKPRVFGWLRGFSLCLVTFGLFLWISSVIMLRLYGKGTPNPFYRSPVVLVHQGGYRFTRHPIYLALLLVLLGKSIFDHSLLLFLTTIITWLFFSIRVVPSEEKALLKKFGQSYQEYKQKTPDYIFAFFKKN